MNDKQLIERLRYCGSDCDTEVCENCPDYQKVCCMEELLTTAAERISELLTELRDERHRHDRYVDFELAQAEELRMLKEKTRWIPVSERCPDKEWMDHGEQTGRILEVIVKIEYAKTATTLFYDGHDGFYNCGEDGEKIYYPVSHWMLLPENPKKESEKK